MNPQHSFYAARNVTTRSENTAELADLARAGLLLSRNGYVTYSAL